MRNSGSLTPTWQIPIIIAIAVILVVLAAFLLTQIDAVQRRSLLPPKRLPVVDQEATAAAEEQDFVYLPGDEIITATPSATPEVGSIASIATPQATAVSDLVPSCDAVPEGWTPYIVKQGDTLSSLAFKYGVSKKAIVQANCLLYEQIIRGQVIYLPQDVNAHLDSTQCGVPEDWIHYVVHPGDTLLMLAEERNSSVYLIMKANCLESTTISPGRKLFLPPPQPTQIVPTKQLPSPTRPRPQVTITATWTRIFFPTATSTPTILPSATGTVPIQTFTATPTLPVPTQTPTPAPTNTGTPLPFTPTSTSVPPTETPTLLPTATPTLIPSSTPTPFVPTATNTATSLPPTSTNTPPPVVPTMTNTAAPLVPTSTNTPIPASPTATAMPIPPTPTATVPVHPPSPPTATSPVSTDPA